MVWWFPLRSGGGQEYIRKGLPEEVAACMLGFEVCTPQEDMKDKQVRQRTWTVLQGISTNVKKKKKTEDGLFPVSNNTGRIRGEWHTSSWDLGSPMAWTLSKACARFLVTLEWNTA